MSSPGSFGNISDVLHDQNARLTQENLRLQEECQKLQALLDDADRKVPQYETALDKLQRKYTEVLAQLDQEREKSYSSKALMNSREARFARQEQIIEELRAELRKSQKTETGLQTALATARETKAESQRLNSEIRRLRDELHDEKSTSETLHEQLADARDKLRRAITREGDVEEQARRHAQDIADMQRSREADVWQAKQDERRVVGRELDMAHAEMGRLRDQLHRAMMSQQAPPAPYHYAAPPPPPLPVQAVPVVCPPQPRTCPSDLYQAGYEDGIATRRRDGLTSSAAIVDPDAPSARRVRRKGALPVDRSTSGDLIATCRRRHCLKRFNVNDNCSMQCGYHPVPPTTSYDGDYFPCCGVLVRPGGPNVFCQFRPHLA